MATPKKKHLIELMIEEGVEWPDGAEYAAQDKDCQNVHFYKTKPLKGCDTYWSASGCIAYSGIQLQSLCRNWHQTIVTRDQYAEAVAASGGVEQEQESYQDVGDVAPSESTESLLAEIKAKCEEHDALVAKSDALELEIASIEQQVNDKLNEYGFAISRVAASLESEQPVITDWRDLRVGDVIECVLVRGRNGVEICEYDNEFHGLTCNVIGFTESGKNHIKTDLKPSGYYIQEFKFIRRP